MRSFYIVGNGAFRDYFDNFISTSCILCLHSYNILLVIAFICTNAFVITAQAALSSEPDIIPPSISGEFTPENQGSPMTFTLMVVDDQIVENDEVLLIDISSPEPSLDGLEIVSILIVDTDSKYVFIVVCKFVPVKEQGLLDPLV